MNVRCEKCQAEYSIDDARIPAEGLQIKCPQCLTTFIVQKPGAMETAGDLFELSDLETDQPTTDSLELDLPSEVDLVDTPDLPPIPPPPARNAPPPPKMNIGGSSFPKPESPRASSLPEIPDPGSPSPAPTPGNEGQIFDFIDHGIGEGKAEAEQPQAVRYRIRRKSGKVFGPFDSETVNKMLADHQLMGNEEASVDGHTFKPLGAFPEFAATIRLLMDGPQEDEVAAPAPVATPIRSVGAKAAPPPASVVEFEDDDDMAEVALPSLKGVDFADPPPLIEKKRTMAPGTGTFLLLGVLLLILAGVGLGFTRFGWFGYKLFSSGSGGGRESGGGADGGDSTSIDEARQLYFRDTYGGYEGVVRVLEKDLDHASPERLYLLGLSYGALLRNYGANEFYVSQGKKVLDRITDTASGTPEARKVEASFLILSDAAKAQGLLEPLLDKDSRDKEALFLGGWALAYQKKWPDAAQLFDRATLLDPDYVKAYHAMGDAQSLQGDFGNALTFYEKALTLNPQHINSSLEKARILIEVKNDPVLGEKELERVFGKYFGEMAPSERAKAHALRAKLFLSRRELDKAEKDLKSAVELTPNRQDSLTGLGEFLIDTGKYGEALSMFERALQVDPASPDAQVGKGHALWRNGDIVGAKVFLEQTAAKVPGDPRPLYLLGQIAEDLMKPDEAMAFFQKAAGLSPTFLKARVAIARLELKKGNLKQALEELSQASRADPRSAVVHDGLGELYLVQGNLRLAKEEFDEALRLDPDLVSAHFHLANTLRESGSLDEAIAEYRKVAVISPHYPDLEYEQGYTQYLKKQFAESLKTYEEAIRRTPKDDRLYVRAGMAADAAGDSQSAIKYFQTATGLNNQNMDAVFRLGVLFLRQKEYEQSLDLLKKVSEVDPKNAEARYQMGLAYLAQEMTSEAIDEFRETIRLKPKHVDALSELGKALIGKGQLDEAIRFFDRAVREQPDRIEVLLALGDTYTQQGMSPKALKIYQKAQAKNPKYPGLSYRLGRAFDEQEKKKDAIKHYLKAIKEDPQDPMPHYYLGFAYKAQRKYKLALGEFKRYLQLRPDAPDAEDVKDEIYYLQQD